MFAMCKQPSASRESATDLGLLSNMTEAHLKGADNCLSVFCATAAKLSQVRSPFAVNSARCDERLCVELVDSVCRLGKEPHPNAYHLLA